MIFSNSTARPGSSAYDAQSRYNLTNLADATATSREVRAFAQLLTLLQLDAGLAQFEFDVKREIRRVDADEHVRLPRQHALCALMNSYIENLRTGTNQNYFSGAYAFSSYKASIVYAILTYRF